MSRKGWVLWAPGACGWRPHCQRREWRGDLLSVACSIAKPELLEQLSTPAVSLKLGFLWSSGWSDPSLSKDEAGKEYMITFPLAISGRHPCVLAERWFVRWGCCQAVLESSALGSSLGQRKFFKLGVSQQWMKLKVFPRALNYWAERRGAAAAHAVNLHELMPNASQLSSSPSGMLKWGSFRATAPGGACLTVKCHWHRPTSPAQLCWEPVLAFLSSGCPHLASASAASCFLGHGLNSPLPSSLHELNQETHQPTFLYDFLSKQMPSHALTWQSPLVIAHKNLSQRNVPFLPGKGECFAVTTPWQHLNTVSSRIGVSFYFYFVRFSPKYSQWQLSEITC